MCQTLELSEMNDQRTNQVRLLMLEDKDEDDDNDDGKTDLAGAGVAANDDHRDDDEDARAMPSCANDALPGALSFKNV